MRVRGCDSLLRHLAVRRLGVGLVTLMMCAAGLLPGISTAAPAQAASVWHFTTPFSQGRTSVSSVKIGQRMYVIGGYSYNEATETLSIYNDVQWASVESSGNITSGGWHETTPFTVDRLGQSAVAYHHFIYVLGGGNGIESYYNTVEYASVGSDGNITPSGWHTTSSLNIPRADLSTNVTMVNGRSYLYVIGGVGSKPNGETIHFGSVEYAEIHEDGSLGPWTLSPSEFARPRSAMTTTIVDHCIYVIGGFGEAFTEVLGEVQYACIKPDASLGPWTLSPNSMHDVRYGAEMLVVPADNSQLTNTGSENGENIEGPAKLIVIGGDAGEGIYLREVESATAYGPYGNTAWKVAPESSWLPEGQWGQDGVVLGERGYVLGGVLRSQEYLNQVKFAPISALLE